LSAIEFGINFALPEKDPPVASSADVLPDINEFPILDAGINSVENQTVMTKVRSTRIMFVMINVKCKHKSYLPMFIMQ
jgi:hypothetical protein